MNENDGKKATDRVVGLLLKDQFYDTKVMAQDVAESLRDVAKKIVICGAAGSGKTELSTELGKILGFKVFNVDDLVPGGFTEDEEKYRRRLEDAWMLLIAKLPSSGWIVEHIEACNPMLTKVIEPDYAILMTPTLDKVLEVARARDSVSAAIGINRERRARASVGIASSQFGGVSGEEVIKIEDGLIVKKIN